MNTGTGMTTKYFNHNTGKWCDGTPLPSEMANYTAIRLPIENCNYLMVVLTAVWEKGRVAAVNGGY